MTEKEYRKIYNFILVLVFFKLCVRRQSKQSNRAAAVFW